jgi:tripartite-type tricarboxylate transporter receptor subunit TctC
MTMSNTKHVFQKATLKAKFALGALALGSAAAASAAYPERPITMVVSYPPGGTVDLVARLIAPELEKELGQTVIVDNKGGAGGMLGGAYVARAKPDGYTILMDASNHAQNPALREKMTFDTLKDFSPVSLLIKVPNILVVNPASSIKTVADVKAEDKASEHTLYYASSGPGSAQHLAGELFNVLAQTQLIHVPYKGGGPAMIDVMGNQVPMMFASLGSSWTHIKSGKLRAIAVGGTERTKLLPEVPTIAEEGLAGYASYEWNAIFAPAGTPQDILDRVSSALAKVLQNPTVQQRLADLGADTIGSSPDELRTFVQDEITKWKGVAAKAKISLD